MYIFSDPDEVYVSPWFAFKSLQFLWEKDKPREIGTVSIIIIVFAFVFALPLLIRHLR